MHTVTSTERTENSVLLACNVVDGASGGSLGAGGVVLRLTSDVFLAPLLFEVGGCQSVSELIWKMGH